MLVRVMVASALASLLAGCTPGAPPTTGQTPSAPIAWVQVALPEGTRASSLAVVGNNLLVGGFQGSGTAGGGQTPDDAAPSLLVVGAGTVHGTFRLEPADPYAKVADLVSLTVAGDRVFAIGKAVGGAHSNPRLTLWDGSIDASLLTSHTQAFFTFGGHDAGPLLGTAVVNGGPVIFGSRVGPRGAYGVLWTRKGHTWSPQDSRPELVSTPDRELGFSALARQGDRLVVAGDELGLAGGLNQQPVVFVGTVAGAWQELRLPVPDGLTRVPGQTSTASSVACEDGGACWVSGWVRGHPLAWPVRVPADGDATAGDPTTLPGDPPAGNGPVTAVALAGTRPAVLTNATTPSLQLGCPDGWRTLAAPPGQVTTVVSAPDTLYAVAGAALWRLTLPAC